MWKQSSPTKIYEAIGAVADGRVKVSGNTGTCASSSGNKYYEISYDPDSHSIMSNDSTSYWTGELRYPAVAFLLQNEVLTYREDLGKLLTGIPWKDINQKFKNDFDTALQYILQDMDLNHKTKLEDYVHYLLEEIQALNLQKLGIQTIPPKGY